MEKYIEKGAPLNETQNTSDLIGLRVLTSSGEVLGNVKHVRLHIKTHALEGVLVKRGLFGNTLYMCEHYIDRITNDAVLLNIEPALLYVRRKVVSSDGKVFGRVMQVHRAHETNQISSLLVRRGMFRKVTLPFSHVKKLGDAIILKKTYAEAKKHGS